MNIRKLASIAFSTVLFMVGISGVNAAKIKVSKVEVGTNKPISGATLTLSKPKAGSAMGDVVASWTTDGSVKVIDVEPGTYKLVENEPAPGYLAAEDQEVVISASLTEINIVSISDYTKAEFRAINEKTKKDIKGVKFELYN